LCFIFQAGFHDPKMLFLGEEPGDKTGA